MNIDLLESFGSIVPEELEMTLDHPSQAITCVFNRHGTLLAVGGNDGKIIIWDFLTRGVAKTLAGQSHPIVCLNWSRSGHKILSASTEHTICLWDVLSGDVQIKYRLQTPILKVQFNPRNDRFFMVCPMKHPPIIINLDGAIHQDVPVEEEDTKITASFDRRGKFLYMGNGRGTITLLTFPKLEVKCTWRLNASVSVGVKSMDVCRKNEWVLFNCSDRIIRVYNMQQMLKAKKKQADIEPVVKYQDLVNKIVWKRAAFSGDGAFVCAGTTENALHVWERCSGNLLKVLTISKGETFMDLTWHPVRSVIASVSFGAVSIWAQHQAENWSAFAPDFSELDENVEYDERESEFDYEDEDKPTKAVEADEDDDIEVDVLTVDKVPYLCSSDEEENPVMDLLLPITPECDEPQQLTPGNRGKVTSGKISPPPKRSRCQIRHIMLEGVSAEEVHPLLAKGKGEKSPSTPFKANSKRVKRNRT